MNCHNGQEFVQESVKSLISQTYKNWELIFYDNFSRDLSIKIIRSFKDKRIKFFKSNKFLKLYDARNNAIKFAKGKYIAFLDTDDYWKKDKLTKQVNFVLKKKIKMCYSNYYIHYNSKKKKA
jgi:glycosyltransferase involved in cell wall biosynthesis